MKLKHWTQLVSAAFFVFGSSVSSIALAKERPADKPNIIVIVADDAGFMDFGFMGSPDLETPNLDKLAAEGTVFSDAHVTASVCAPSRAGLMLGRYQQRGGAEANGHAPGLGMDLNDRSMATVLKTRGYKTAALGKWHLGHGAAYHPNKRGFDEFYGFLTGSRSYFPMKDPSEDKMLQHNGERVIFDGYMTDVLGDQSVKYVEQFKDEPFFMYLAFNAVHTPMHAKKEHLEKYKDHKRKELAAMTWSMDENIGNLVNKLEELNLMEDTLIFFLSDNGGPYNNQSDNGPLKGRKGSKFEGGNRVPFVLSWRGKTLPKTFDGLSSALDIFPTAMAVAGVDSKEKPYLDGVNLLPYLSGEAKGDPHDMLFWRKLDMAGARVGDMKLIRVKDFGFRMYNLADDLAESQDLRTEDPKTFEQMKRLLELWETGLMEPLWREGAQWEPVTRHIHESLMDNKKPKYTSPWARERYLKKQNKSQ